MACKGGFAEAISGVGGMAAGATSLDTTFCNLGDRKVLISSNWYMQMTRSHYKVKRSMVISLELTHDHWSVPDSTAVRLAAVVGAAQD